MGDEDVAAVLTYIRRSRGNTGTPVDGDTVKAIRAETAGRTRPDRRRTHGASGWHTTVTVARRRGTPAEQFRPESRPRRYRHVRCERSDRLLTRTTQRRCRDAWTIRPRGVCDHHRQRGCGADAAAGTDALATTRRRTAAAPAGDRPTQVNWQAGVGAGDPSGGERFAGVELEPPS